MSEARGGSPKPFEFNAELTELRVSLERLDDPLDDDKLFRTALPLCDRVGVGTVVHEEPQPLHVPGQAARGGQ